MFNMLYFENFASYKNVTKDAFSLELVKEHKYKNNFFFLIFASFLGRPM